MACMATITIDTEHGPATITPTDQGWTLRYADADGVEQEKELPADQVALLYLAMEGIGAGRKLTIPDAAREAGVGESNLRRDISDGRQPAALVDEVTSRRLWWESWAIGLKWFGRRRHRAPAETPVKVSTRSPEDWEIRAIPLIARMRAAGASYRAIGEALDRAGLKPRAADKWNPATVRAVGQRAGVA